MKLTSYRSFGFFYGLAVLILLLLAHIPALFNKQPFVEVSFGFAFMLIFPLWAFLIYYLNATVKIEEKKIKEFTFFQKLRMVFGNPPIWSMWVMGVIYVYGLYSLYLWFTGGIFDPEFINGRYEIFNHGKITYYTNEQYWVMHRQHILATTGFFLMFASVAVLVLLPRSSNSAQVQNSRHK